VRDEIIELADTLGRKGPSRAEFERARHLLRQEFAAAAEIPVQWTRYTARLALNGSSPDEFLGLSERIAGISMEDLERIDRFLRRDAAFTVVVRSIESEGSGGRK
jgi:predicted Zn-dependent peptidase